MSRRVSFSESTVSADRAKEIQDEKREKSRRRKERKEKKIEEKRIKREKQYWKEKAEQKIMKKID